MFAGICFKELNVINRFQLKHRNILEWRLYFLQLILKNVLYSTARDSFRPISVEVGMKHLPWKLSGEKDPTQWVRVLNF